VIELQVNHAAQSHQGTHVTAGIDTIQYVKNKNSRTPRSTAVSTGAQLSRIPAAATAQSKQLNRCSTHIGLV